MEERVVRRFRKKPIEIEALQLLWTNWNEMCKFVDKDYFGGGFYPDGIDKGTLGLKIKTLEGVMEAREGDWIIKGVNGKFYPCKDEIFRKIYEEVREDRSEGETNVSG